MKRLTLLMVMIITVCLAFAGIDEYYTFNETSGTYTPIAGTDAYISADDVISSAIPIGFTFPYGEYTYTEVIISSNGWIGLGASQTSNNIFNNLASTTVVPVIAPLWDDCSLSAGSCEYLLSGTAPDRIFIIQYSSLKWNYNSTTMFNLQVRLYENGKIDIVYGSSTGDPYSPTASIGINMLPGGSSWFYSVTPGTPATTSTTAENNIVGFWPGEGTIYEFNPVVAVPNDLAALSITGNTIPTAGQSSNYIVTVRNRGTNPQSTYQVKLLLGTQEVGSVNGTTIQPGEILTYTIPWTPTTAGPGVLYGKVVLAGDQNPNNDQTPPLNIVVQPAGVQAVTIGAGDQLARVPMDFYWKNSLFECLFYPNELGFTSGTITSIAFYNNFADSPANGATKIWLGSTNLADLSAGWIPSTQLTLVFDGNVTYPAGTNTITIPLQTPYTHTPGNVVMMVQRPMDTAYCSGYDYFLAQTIGSTRALKVQSDSTPYDPANPPAGTTPTGQFPKTTIFYIEQGVENDLAALNISGSTSCNVGSSYVYTITVKNNGTTTQSNYTVKLIQEGGIELGSVEGTTINTMATLQFTIPWTPSTAGETYLYGEVVLTGDENPSNNQTSHLNVTVQDSEVLSVTIGSGDQLAMVPMNFYYMNSLFECLYYPEELGFSNVTITALAFYNNFNVAVPNGTTRIWLGTTTQPNLSNGWIPSTELSLVFDGNVNYPTGSNTIIIPLQTPYMYFSGNLVMMVHRPMDTQYYSDADYFLAQTIGNNRARMAQRDIVNNFNPANPPSEFTALTGQFPKTTIFYSDQLIATDLSCLDINGNITPSAGAETQYTITVKNNGTATQSNYTVKLMQEGGVLINSVPGTPINSMQTLNFTINWTPGESGSTYIYGEVEVTGDEVITNNQTKHQNIEIYPDGMIVKTVGMGNCIGRIPILFYWKNSLTETIYLASEINGTGLITDIQYYNNFVSNLYGKPINIWMGETTLTDLSGGWIPCTQLTQVFSGTVDFPTGQNDIMIHLSTPYFYNGGNLVVMVERPWDTHYYFNPDVFILHMGTEICRTLSNASDFEDYDPANPPTDASVEDVVPVTTFIFDTSVSGTIAGTVNNQQNAPIMGATVTCGTITATTNASGAYSMQVPAGTHSVTASAPGYDSVTHSNVVVITNQTTTVNFILPPSSTLILLEDSFETYENFALTFAPWTCVDVDQSATYGIQGYSFPNCYSPMAYIIFVPSATTPPLTATDVTHTGNKVAASFASTTPPNNDWLITPVLNNPTQITFWARSYTAQYGLERFKVGVSTTGTNPSNFTIISGPNYIQAPVDWTEYTYEIEGYTGNVYIGIQCVSNDAFIFLLDDVTVEGTPLEDPNVPVLATELQGNYPNPFNPETTIRYSVKETSPVTIEVYNLKGQLVRTLVNEVKTAGNYSVVWNGRDNHNQPVSSGVYFYKMNAGKYSSTKKMIMMK